MHAARALTMFMCIGFFFLVATTVGADPRPPFRMLVRSVEFSDDGKLLVVVITRRWNSFTDSTMGLIDVSKGKWAPVKFDMGFPGKVLTATFTPDGTAAVSGREDSTIRFSDIGTGKKIRMLKTDSKGVNCLSFSGDGKLLLSGETGGLVLWDVEKEKPIRRLTGKRITSAVLSKNGKLALSDDE